MRGGRGGKGGWARGVLCSLCLILIFDLDSPVLEGALWFCPLFFSLVVVVPCFLFFFLNL